MSNRPAPELAISPDLVSSLLQRQHPDLASQPVSVLDRGWDNTNLRLGDELLVRMPHRKAAAELILNEQRWLPELAPVLPWPISDPERVGQPDLGFPWNWSVSRWYPGEVAAKSALANETQTAGELGRFLAALHHPAPAQAPENPYRGVAIKSRKESFYQNLAALDAADSSLSWDPEAIRRLFDQAVLATETHERVWLHGDLHGKNVIVDDGQIAAVIDWGDICCGDRATDLASAWMLVPSAVTEVAEVAGADEQAWIRAKGWAVHFAVLYLLHSDDDQTMGSVGARLMNALID